MLLLVNGEAREVKAGTTVLQFLKDNGKDSEKAVVEHNRVILMSEDFEKTVLQEGDRLEILVFVGGG